MVPATLDGHPFPFNPNSLNWGYTLNTSVTDTLGGRVIQVLSVKIDSMTWEGEAGSRDRLLALYDQVHAIMLKHAQTERPVQLVIPSKNWVMSVFITSMPGMGWNLSTVSYQYRLSLEVDEDFSGVVSGNIISHELSVLAAGIGYDPNWHGGDLHQVDYGTPYQGPTGLPAASGPPISAAPKVIRTGGLS